MPRIPSRSVMTLPLLLAGCIAVDTSRGMPTVAEGHVGQLITASSTIDGGRSVIGHARDVLDDILAGNREMIRSIRSRDFPEAKRLIADMAETNAPRTGSERRERPGLRATIERALLHMELAARADDASEAIRRDAPEIRRKASRLLEDATTLTSYIDFGLGVDSIESLSIVAEEIDSIARQMEGGLFVADGYSLDGFHQDLERMLGGGSGRPVAIDPWLLQNFERVEGSEDWRFERRPRVQGRNIF